jgi:aminoglycoside 3-N-acetyltransferase
MTGSGLSRDELASALAAAGLPTGPDVLVHCSMRALGPVDGGPATLLDALRDVVGPESTVVVPAQTANNSTTSPDYRAATASLDGAGRRAFQAAMPGFDRASTPSWRMGRFAEHLRGQPGAVRSGHPQTSFAALGPAAEKRMWVHALPSHLGEESPLAALYAADAWILLLGVGFDRCTALHLAEHRLPWAPSTRPYRCFVARGDGQREQLDFVGVDHDISDFERIGQWLIAAGLVRSGPVGRAVAMTVPLIGAVDLAVGWMTRHRNR